MFLNFLLFLRKGGLKVSLHDWLSLIEGLHMGLHCQTLDGFFILSRALLVKTESDLDKYEEMFWRYFRNINSEKLREELESLQQDPEEAERVFREYRETADIDQAALMNALEQRLVVEAAEREESTGTGGETVNSSKAKGIGAGPGASGAVMPQGAGGRSVVHARGDRKFRDWRTDCTIESRQFQMAFRMLRELSRKLENNEEELDIRGTIDHTCRRGGILDIRMQPPRKNRLKLMVLIDSGGSMKPYEQLCSLLFQSLNKANTFSDLKIYYFHNCLEGVLYKDPSIDTEDTVKTDWVLRNIAGEYKVIFVGDAEMAMHELVDSNYCSWMNTPPDGITWFKRFKEKYENSIWLHPQEREENINWMSESFIEIEKVFPMYRLSIDGLKEGMYKLMKKR